MAQRVVTVSIPEYAKDHGVTETTIRNWIAAGMPHRTIGRERRIVRAEANKWVRERDRREAKEETAPSEVEERARKLRAEADLKELDLKERRKILVPADQYRERLESFVGGFAAVAAGQLARFERDIVRAGDAAAARLVTQAIHEALMRGSQEYADQLDAERAALAEAEDAAA